MKKYDCIVIGGGHAGVEAALASSRMGSATLMVTMHFDAIGQMSCNPAIGGVGKGQLVKEIDALGGEMGLAADKTGIQFRQLNASKGQAVRSSRCQSDKKKYKLYMQEVVKNQENLDVFEGKAGEICDENGKIVGVKTEDGQKFLCQCVVIASGTFLNGRIHIGSEITAGGRIGESNVVRISENLQDFGFEINFFKTGTPPRLDGRTIDFSQLSAQHSDTPPQPFSFRTKGISKEQILRPCHITHTNSRTHEIIKENMHLSPMYSGQIQATGVRYCPSIEDKLKKFGDKNQHQVFLEPQGLDTEVYYPNGISTGLPLEVQKQFVRSIKGLENVEIIKPGYSIEHGVIDPTELQATLESKRIEGLFFAGQINRTTGYEEAAAQGLIAGINASLKVQNKPPFILGRNEAYIGVLIDDLITKGSEEPYRMFTSRVEYRLIIREDNADKRMIKYARTFGLLTEKDLQRVEDKYAAIAEEIEMLKTTRIPVGTAIDQELIKRKTTPLRQSALLSDILRRPQVDYQMVASFNSQEKSLSAEIINQIEYEIKYEGFIAQQQKSVEKFQHIEKIKIPKNIDYENIQGLSIEIRQKLKKFNPINLGQANRISGVTPAAISTLMIYLRKQSLERKTI